MAYKKLYITKKHQEWTCTSKKDLVPYLDGFDDDIYEFLVPSDEFAIVLKNDLTFDVKNSAKEAIEYVEHIYRNYNIIKNESDYCFIARDDLTRVYKTAGDAQDDGVFDYVYIPTGFYYLTKYNKILWVTDSEEEATNKMYEHYKAKYTYVL